MWSQHIVKILLKCLSQNRIAHKKKRRDIFALAEEKVFYPFLQQKSSAKSQYAWQKAD